MSHYMNPLNPPPTNFYGPSTLSYAPHRNVSAPHYRSVTRPQPTFNPISKWKSSMGQALPLARPVTFDFKGRSNQGVPMSQFSTGECSTVISMMQGPHDPIFVNTALRKITFRILWPGYEYVEWARPIELHLPHGPITRCHLGAVIASNYARFIEKCQYEATKSPEWRLGPTGIRFEHLLLLSLWNVSGDSWQAEVAVDMM